MAQVTINGTAYEMPETLTLKELRIMERYTDGHLSGDGYEVSKMSGMIHVAVMRQRPELGFDEIQAVVDTLDVDSLEGALGEGDAGPPEVDASETVKSEPSGEKIPCRLRGPSPGNGTRRVLASRTRSLVSPRSTGPRRAHSRAADGLPRLHPTSNERQVGAPQDRGCDCR